MCSRSSNTMPVATDVSSSFAVTDNTTIASARQQPPLTPTTT